MDAELLEQLRLMNAQMAAMNDRVVGIGERVNAIENRPQESKIEQGSTSPAGEDDRVVAQVLQGIRTKDPNAVAPSATGDEGRKALNQSI